jgi:hypothetical protein
VSDLKRVEYLKVVPVVGLKHHVIENFFRDGTKEHRCYRCRLLCNPVDFGMTWVDDHGDRVCHGH